MIIIIIINQVMIKIIEITIILIIIKILKIKILIVKEYMNLLFLINKKHTNRIKIIYNNNK